jgi:DNA repair protein RecO (recombination protein O)
MPAEHATAIVIRTVDFSETSLVVTLFTREAGKLGALAKGGRRLKGPFESALDLLSRCRILFLRKSADALDLLMEAKLIGRFRPVGRDLAPWYAGQYVAELLNELTEPYDPYPELFDLTETTLDALAAGRPVGRHLLRFELGALRVLGQLPSLDRCVECDRVIEPRARVPFGLLDGGVLCPAHRAGRRHVVSVSAEGIGLMRRLADAASGDGEQMPPPGRTIGELRGVINQYMAHLLGHRPRSIQFLHNLQT